jgi:hypothetical protein
VQTMILPDEKREFELLQAFRGFNAQEVDGDRRSAIPPEALLLEAIPPVAGKALDDDEELDVAAAAGAIDGTEELEVLACEEFELKQLPASEPPPSSSLGTLLLAELVSFLPINIPRPPLIGAAAGAEERLPSELKELRARALVELPNIVQSLSFFTHSLGLRLSFTR